MLHSRNFSLYYSSSGIYQKYSISNKVGNALPWTIAFAPWGRRERQPLAHLGSWWAGPAGNIRVWQPQLYSVCRVFVTKQNQCWSHSVCGSTWAFVAAAGRCEAAAAAGGHVGVVHPVRTRWQVSRRFGFCRLVGGVLAAFCHGFCWSVWASRRIPTFPLLACLELVACRDRVELGRVSLLGGHAAWVYETFLSLTSLSFSSWLHTVFTLIFVPVSPYPIPPLEFVWLFLFSPQPSLVAAWACGLGVAWSLPPPPGMGCN